MPSSTAKALHYGDTTAELDTIDGPTIPTTSPAKTNTSLVIRNVTVNMHRTSIRLEPEMWQALAEICKRERCSTHNICTMISGCRQGPGSLTAAIRVFIMSYYRAAASEDGHNRAGHGSGTVLQPLYAMLARQAMADEPAHQTRQRPVW